MSYQLYDALLDAGASEEKASTQPCSSTSARFKWDNVILYGQYVLDRALVR